MLDDLEIVLINLQPNVLVPLVPVDTLSDSAYTRLICHGGYLIVQHQNLKWSRTACCSSGTPAAPPFLGRDAVLVVFW